MNVFDHQYAAYYDALYRDKDYQGEADFVSTLLRKHGARRGSLLDLGCGTAMHAGILAESFQEVVGVDLSIRMLAMAEARRARMPRRIARRLSLQPGDIRTVRLRRRFDAVLALFHVLSYQLDNDDLLAALKTTALHAHEESLIFLDFWHGPGVLTDRPATRVKRIDSPERTISRIAVPELFPNRNAVVVRYDVTVIEKEEEKFYQFNEEHRMRYLFRPELEFLCNQAGMEILEFGEWMTAAEPTLNTWAAYLIARPRRASSRKKRPARAASS